MSVHLTTPKEQTNELVNINRQACLNAWVNMHLNKCLFPLLEMSVKGSHTVLLAGQIVMETCTAVTMKMDGSGLRLGFM